MYKKDIIQITAMSYVAIVLFTNNMIGFFQILCSQGRENDIKVRSVWLEILKLTKFQAFVSLF